MPKKTDFELGVKAGYQSALADIAAVIENAQAGRGNRHHGAEIDAVERWIKDNTVSPDQSQTYRGYWIEKPDNAPSGIVCFDIYRSKADVGRVTHLDCVPSLSIAKKTIDDWKRAR